MKSRNLVHLDLQIHKREILATRDADTEIITQSRKELENAEKRQDTEIPVRIYPEIYPETRSTAVLKKMGPGEEESSLQLCRHAETVKKAETSEIQKPSNLDLQIHSRKTRRFLQLIQIQVTNG